MSMYSNIKKEIMWFLSKFKYHAGHEAYLGKM